VSSLRYAKNSKATDGKTKTDTVSAVDRVGMRGLSVESANVQLGLKVQSFGL
jgi:hypothetical protein